MLDIIGTFTVGVQRGVNFQFRAKMTKFSHPGLGRFSTSMSAHWCLYALDLRTQYREPIHMLDIIGTGTVGVQRGVNFQFRAKMTKFSNPGLMRFLQLRAPNGACTRYI